MLSPAGICIKPPTFNIDDYNSFFMKIVKKAWKKKWSPFGILRNCGSVIAKSLIKKFISRRLDGSLTKDEMKDMLKYMH